MASGSERVKDSSGNIPVGEDSSESEGETEPAKSFHRRLSTNREIKCSASIKEGFLLKQTWSFQRWRRRYFKLKGRKLYYAKDTKAVIFDEIELTDLCLAECSIKNVNHSFQVITPFRSLVLCAESRREMEDWLGALSAATQRRFHEPDQPDFLSGYHHWYATSHARPTYCNVCREALSGVTSHGLSCEVCKSKVHKRCAAKAINNCKWTTLSSVGKDIIEDTDGNITMPHQWMEGNLPVSAKCAVCDKNCGSVLRLQDWRCLWCRVTVHTACRPLLAPACPLGPARVSVVPPTALHSVQDEAWEAVRPQASSPLLVFVNSKSGDNQGVKFLRRFKQLLNPAQVFDLISTGPRLGLRLFRHFDPFRILVCSGDGSVGWVLSEIDKLDMHKQCQVAVLPLGTGNDLARVLGWGSSCDDDTHLPQLLEKYEKAGTKMLDRWSIMTFERTIAIPKLSLTTTQPTNQLHNTMAQYETSLVTHIQNILQSEETSVVLNSAKHLCETVKDFASQISDSSHTRGDEQLSSKCDLLYQKLDLLLQTLTNEEFEAANFEAMDDDEHKPSKHSEYMKDDSETDIAGERRKSEKLEKDLSNIKSRSRRRTKVIERESLIVRANSLKRAIRNLIEHTEQVVDEQNRQTAANVIPTIKISISGDFDKPECELKGMDTLKVLPTIDSASSTEPSPCPSPSPTVDRLSSISPLPDIRRDSTCEESESLLNLPVPSQFADGSSRRSSQTQPDTDDVSQSLLTVVPAQNIDPNEQLMQISNESIDINAETETQRTDKTMPADYDDKECSSILSAISNEEVSIASDILDQKPFGPRKNSDGEDINGHIYHIDSPETDTYPNSEALHGESIMDDMSSVLAMTGCDQDSGENTYTDDTTMFTSEFTERKCDDKKVERKKSMKRDSEKRRRTTKIKPEKLDTTQFGFENRAFMTNLHVDKDNRLEESKFIEPVKYCSLAQFVEGNDIARMSFKRNKSATKLSKTEANVNRQSVLSEEVENTVNLSIKGSNLSLDQLDPNKCTEIEPTTFPQVSVIVEPPSPVLSEQIRMDRIDRLSQENLPSVISSEEKDMQCGSDYDLSRSLREDCQLSKLDRLSIKSDRTSNHSSTSNLLGIDSEQTQFLSCSPAASRRISSGSLLKADEAAALAASASSLNPDNDKDKKDEKDEKSHDNKRLPIINPLVRLPSWPHVSGTSGLISKCLLANADALCAAVSPLMDPDETLLEGFFERCVMNNYFGIGIDAKISLDFHHKREEHPEKCRSRAKNYMWYGVLGSKQWLQKTYKNLDQRVQLECDGQRIPLPSLQGIVILNIPSFMGGTNFWGGRKQDDIFLAPSFDDRILEVVAVFGSVQMAASRLINLQHHRIAQCQTVQINILGEEGVPIQVDGEAWIQPPGMIRIIHKNRMQMLCRNRALEESLRSWEEKQRVSVQDKPRQATAQDKVRLSLPRQSVPSGGERSLLGVPVIDKVRQHSFSGQGLTVNVPNLLEKSQSVSCIRKANMEPDILFTDEEHYMLLNFIECATSLAKWVKILAISYSLEVDLYTVAVKTDTCLENIHPNGKILEGPNLRVEFTKLVQAVKHLYEECCCLLHDKGHKLKLREDLENKLSASLTNTEMELRKCYMLETSNGTLVYLQTVHEDQYERKRKSLFWLKFRSKAGVSQQSQTSHKQARDVASWGTQEVASWLETLQLSEYVDSFVKNDIRGRELLTLARRDLKDLGVTKVGHVKRILQAIKDLTQGF
ncbi:uncharacterized protein CBL_06646 [Carabus blaptoides fortunei]